MTALETQAERIGQAWFARGKAGAAEVLREVIASEATILCAILADIRAVTGVGTKPMLRELPEAIKASHVDAAKLAAERDFLISRAAAKHKWGEPRWTGASSDALVDVAYGSVNKTLPYDASDLAACYRTIMRMPEHLRSKAVLDQLEEGERYIGCAITIARARQESGWLPLPPAQKGEG
jgi:hypothetical protein